MPNSPVILDLPSPDATSALGVSLAPKLAAGDVILLEGGIGAGKTHFARALIQSLLPTPEDVPSPTFTLVQIYDGPGFEVWHADLYRLSGLDEAAELGLQDAFANAVCLIEWPDRLAELTPSDALHLTLEPGADDTRRLTASWSHPKWADKLKDIAT
ncbi:tRNA (adenosine(37)-N6)-threonylcarbamoyltransferase complex ATPase subunit type 1 TsaE [Thalassovita taeanensis]|uniref:tRNA threonylcarbamoyladenosine biosynthesis protein TsaE n=1 Tax=Thalassovita taeanensis TaxID=657014 RepID=A0A1H9JI28_9RHOB|nr:tRNA (adenosine(37)-N6)-threonylcarbamoyltransferase complex ATPase subunit type 1 TsaE [Thalassovita taeanensis]SEQ86470.1 tRNA threonylcarbamoyladenosine biosynthesis protein TsaE [Thalassovita taeanensis]